MPSGDSDDSERGGPVRSEVEWLDVGPPVHPDGSRARLPRWRWWYALVALALLAAVIVSVQRHAARRAVAHPAPTPSASPSSTPASVSASVAASSEPASALPTISVTSLGHPLLDVSSSWELFGLGPSSVVRIQLALGRMTTTPTSLVTGDGGPVTFIVASDRVITQSAQAEQGYEVRDGRLQSELPAALAGPGPILPGPDPGHVWALDSGSTQRVRLVGIDGTPTGTTLTLPGDVNAVTSDDDGYLLFYGLSGVYDLRPSGITRITTGNLLAMGPTRWLVGECDSHYHCTTSVIDRASGARHQPTHPINGDDFFGDGVISPDGRTAVLLRSGQTDQDSSPICLLDLDSGASRCTTLTFTSAQSYQDGAFVWSPDNRWVFATSGTGRLYAIDARSAQITTLDVVAGPITQLGLRTGG